MWNQTLFTIQETPVTALNLLTFIAILILTWVIAKGVRALVMRMVFLQDYISSAALYGLGRMVYYIVLLIGSYIALITIGIDLTGIAVVIGALSVGIGFGLQSIFNNLAAGIILLIEKKVRIGDMIQLDSGEVGHIKEINVRSTLICTLDNRKILIPNTDIVSKKLINWTLGDHSGHRFRIPFVVSRQEDKERVKTLALEVAQKMGLKDTSPAVWLTQIGENTQEFELILWMERKEESLHSESLTATCLWSLDTAFAEKGIKLLQAKRQAGSSLQEL